MNELVVISGKGGTGKTSIAASLAVLHQPVVVADCDVDAADLHLVLAPQIDQRETFTSGYEARLRSGDCGQCGACARLCRFDAIQFVSHGSAGPTYTIDPAACEGCGVCASHCPYGAIDLLPSDCGEWYVSRTRCGPMVHARLFPAAENSGKLVSLVREQARAAAQAAGLTTIIIDGSPGIGCPVMASITGASAALLVAEPTVSGLHDLTRIAQVTAHFQVPTLICINKWDLNAEMTSRIASFAEQQGLTLAGQVRYDRAVTQAQVQGQSLAEYTTEGAGADVRALARAVAAKLEHLSTVS